MFSLMLFFFPFFLPGVEVGHIGVEENGAQKSCVLFLVFFLCSVVPYFLDITLISDHWCRI